MSHCFINLRYLAIFIRMRVIIYDILSFNWWWLPIISSCRQFLWSFRLPGEAQKIDRMMERFAHRYCELNPSIFKHPDTCFVLSFAIIMLNTSLHNPAVKDKQTLDQFINMNRGIDNGDDLPKQLLEVRDSIIIIFLRILRPSSIKAWLDRLPSYSVCR